MRIWIIALGVVSVLALAGEYWYGSWESDEVIVKQNADTASEGIKVHGDWEVTVSDPATGEEMVYAFENALVPTKGNALLTILMQGEGIVKKDDGTNKWSLRFTGGPANELNGYESRIADTSLYQVTNPHGHFGSVGAFQLNKSFIVPEDWVQLKTVHAMLAYVPGLIPSLNSNGDQATNGYVTEKEFDVPIPVQPGQEVSATVRISFE